MDRPASIGFLETPFLSITAMVADYMVKTANVHLLGLEPLGSELILIRIGGSDPAVITTALEAGIAEARRLGVTVTSSIIPAPVPQIFSLNEGPIGTNVLYGGREEMRSSSTTQPNKTLMSTTQKKAIGILETQGLTAILEATDAMLKTADVRLVGKEKIGAAYVTIIIEGDVAAVKAAIDAGSNAVGSLGKLIAAHVIARPHEDLVAILPK